MYQSTCDRCIYSNLLSTTFYVSFHIGQCSENSFGQFCEYSCHCTEGSQCDPQTGACPSGCAAGWSGEPYCQAGKRSACGTEHDLIFFGLKSATIFEISEINARFKITFLYMISVFAIWATV